LKKYPDVLNRKRVLSLELGNLQILASEGVSSEEFHDLTNKISKNAAEKQQ